MRFSALAMIAGLLLCGDARAQSGTGAKDPNLAPETPRLEVQRRPFARANRLAINLTYGFGSSGLGDVHELTDYWASTFGRQPIEDSKGSLQINAAIGFTYYAPYHILAHVGYGAIYEKATADVGGGIMFENWNLLMEVPILVGGYYAFKDRFWVWGAIGPSIHFYGRSWYDLDGPGILDAKTETGAGMQVKIGADVMTSDGCIG